MYDSMRTRQHLALRAALAAGVTLVVAPAVGIAPAAADTGASPTPDASEQVAADRLEAERWMVTDWTTDGQTSIPGTVPTAKVATEHRTTAPATTPRKPQAAPGAPRRAPRVAGHRPWRPSGVCRAREGVWLVGPGDTLDLIARCTGVSIGRLAARNGVRAPAYVIRVGQELQIPGRVTR